ncbi:TonB-dependent siderophore receptor [Paracoccus onubensis]|uniref:TonB-dependent siderophore receptor n=1 Tax=Paracoccus onubensis TaxID=1675788 RepID=UPI0027322B6D|nr:TonB-dependent siderophore receptor [Paracoccus onubensis]MDP0926083.1 TonB-dependent siderophore receptor [Paracoccus onubensis]
MLNRFLGVLLAGTVLPSFVLAQETVVLDEIVLNAESGDTLDQYGYLARSGRQAMRIDTEIKRLPQSVSVITQDQLEDQAPRTMLEALSYTSSATPGVFGFDTRYDAFYLRGFPAYQTGVFRDGLRSFNGLSSWYRNDPYTLEGIAVLKGPASSMFGVSTPGGVVNLVSKRPKDTPFHETSLSYGSNARTQASVDFTGPLDEDGNLLYRFTAVARDADTHLDGYADDHVLIAPSVSYQISDTQKLLVMGEYAKSRTGAMAYNWFDSSLPASDWKVTDEPAGDPDYNIYDQEQFLLGYEYTQDLGSSTQFRQSYRYTKVRSDMRYAARAGTSADDLVPVNWTRYHEDASTHVIDAILEHRFETGSFAHTLAFGADYTLAKYDAHTGSTVLGQAANDAMDVPFYASRKQTQKGIYLADQIERDALTISASARYDWVTTDYADVDLETGEVSAGQQKDEAFTGRLGISYEFANGVTPFANISTSFAPNISQVYENASDSRGAPAEATEALQKEVGLKYELPDGNTMITASVFDIRQDHGMVLVVGDDGRNRGIDYNLTSRGFELEANSTLDNGLNLVASYTHMKVTIDKGTEGTEGKELSGTPNDTLSLFAKYAIPSGAMENLALMGGIRYVGKSFGNDTNTMRNPSRTYVDLGLSYDFAKQGHAGTLLQLNVRNLLDRREQTCTAGWCYQDEGRTIDLNLSRRF